MNRPMPPASENRQNAVKPIRLPQRGTGSSFDLTVLLATSNSLVEDPLELIGALQKQIDISYLYLS